MNVTRRPAREPDTEFARQIHHLAYRDVVERQFGPWVEADQDNFFQGDEHRAFSPGLRGGGWPTCLEVAAIRLLVAPARPGGFHR